MAVIDVEIAVLIPLAQGQGGQIAVHVIEIGQAQKGLAPEHLQPAAGIGGLVLEQAAAHAVGDLGGIALGTAVLALGALAPDQAQRPGTGRQPVS